MKKNYFFTQLPLIYHKIKNGSNHRWIITVFVLYCFSLSAYAQKEKEISPLVCVKKIDAGLFQATFSYENPTKKEVVIDENGSIIKTNNGKKVAKGLNRFKPGLNKKTFTKEFGPGDYVEWTITSNGQTKTVVANGNSAYCEPDDSFIFPVIGNGKSFDLIGQELTSLCDGIAGDEPSPLIFQLDNNKVLVEIIPVKGQFQGAINLLKGITPQCSTIASPFNIPDSDFLLYDSTKSIEEVLEGLAAIDVFITEDVICKLNDYPCVINFARPAYPSIKNALANGNTGLAVSQGDATQTTDIVRESFKLIDDEGNVLPVDGKGITIGVMSNSYDRQPFSTDNESKATLDVRAGDLPGVGNDIHPEPVNVLMDYPYGEASDEGRAMMHIIHDVAPGAKLAFHTGSLSPRNFEVGFKALAGLNESNELIELDLKSNIIVDDISFITEPFFGEGRISVAINAFTDAGGIHFTSAGNFGDNGFQGVFNASSGVPATNFIDSNLTKAHVFGTNSDGSEDYLQKISVVKGTYMIALQWSEAAASQLNENGALADLDIYVVDDLGRLLVGSNRVNIAGDPTEVIVFKSTGTGDANILITSANGPADVPFRYIAFQSNGLTWEYDTPGTPTVSGHAMTEKSVTVGAIRYNKTDPEIFSSYGGGLTDGNSVAVDFAAPDGVDTNVGSIGTKYFSNGVPVDETPQYPNFFGTSASAPSAAAAVALLQSALPTWYPDASNPGKSSKSVSDVIGLFKQNVKTEISPNLQAGAGMIDANKVFNSLAAQTSRITSFVFDPVTDSENAGSTTVTIKIIGEFLPDLDSGDTYDPSLDPSDENKPVVYLDGVAIAYTIGEDGEILAEIPPFSGNPNLQIFTAPKDDSEGNGGFSEPYKFFQDGKNVLTVTANPLTVKFGEAYKSKLTYTVEGIELPEGETSYATILNSLGFPDVAFTTTADDADYPDVNNYPITPFFDGDFVDTDVDGVPDVYDQCPETPADEVVDLNGCSEAQKEVTDFTPAITFKVNFKDENLAIEKNNLIITPKDITTATYGEKVTVELDYSGYGTTNDAGVESFDLINDPAALLAKIKREHLKDFYVDEATGITPVGLINNFKPGESFDADGVDRYQDILDLLENGSWISSENTFINRIEQVPYRGGLYPENEGFTERVYGSVNADLGTGFINFNPLDFTAYLDYFNPEGSTLDGQSIGIINGQALGIINGQALGIINGQAIGIINGQALGIINGQAIGIINGQAIGIVNGQAFGIINGQSIGIVNGQSLGIINGQAFGIINNDSGLGSGLDTNDYNKVFSIIDNTDYSSDCLDAGNCTVSTYYALNLITGVDATNNDLHYIFPGSFINPMSDNFNIIYQKAELTVAKKDLTVKTAALSIPYGGDVSAEITTEFDYAYDDNSENVFPDGIPYYFENTDASDTKEYVLGDKMNVGTYNIFIKDATDNYNVVIGEGHGQLTITEATLTVDVTTAENIKYGGAPDITTEISGFPYSDDEDTSNDEDASTLFPEADGGIPYFFMKQGETPDCETCIKYYLPYVAGADKMNVGVYDIFITDDPTDNYKIEFAAERGTLTVDPATLMVTTTAFSLEYGDSVSDAIETSIEGFENEETLSGIFSDGSDGILIPYLFIKETDDGLDINTVKALGTYTIEVEAPISGNYVIDYGETHGTLSITEATLTVVTTTAPNIKYGGTPEITTSFDDGFADGEGAGNLTNGTYYFMKDGDETKYEIGDKMNVGTYEIFLNDDSTDNYSIVLAEGRGQLIIEAAPLTFNPTALPVKYGVAPVIVPGFGDFAYGEGVSDLIDATYYFKRDGDATLYEIGDEMNVGTYEIFINDDITDNYVIAREGSGQLIVEAAPLTFNPTPLTVAYGEVLEIGPNFGDFVYGQGPSDLIDATYYFKRDGDATLYKIGDEMNVGTYEIFLNDDSTDNYVIVREGSGQLIIEAAPLTFNPTPLTVKYGVAPEIMPNFGDFVYGQGLIDLIDATYYFKRDGDATLYKIGDEMNVGTYEIFLNDDSTDNYTIVREGSGQLIIEAAPLTFNPTPLTVKYGVAPEIMPDFGDFVYGQGPIDLIDATYYFKRDGDPTEYTIGGLNKMNVGTYQIFLNDDPNDNYIIERIGSGILTIQKATLVVTITPVESIVNQGDMPILTTLISDSAYNEKVIDVFGSPVPYEFVDEYGDTFYDTSVPGVFTIRIPDPTNYEISYANEAILLINSNDNSRKVLTFSDCVRYNESTDDYTVIFRYENDNDETVFVAIGDDNKLDGVVIEGEPPTSFNPGGGTFEIRFDGGQLTWSLTTNGSTNNSSVSSSNQSGTGECDAKIDADYTLYPNPVIGDELTITQNEDEVSIVYILDMYGRILSTDDGFDGNNKDIIINMSQGNLYPDGMYIVKIVSQDQVKTYNIIKE